MKKIWLAVLAITVMVTFSLAQKIAMPMKQVQINSRTLEKQPTTIDLTRKGTIYTLAAGVDYSRIQVRTAKGVMTMADLLKKTGKTVTGKLRVGVSSDMRAQKLNLGRGRSLNYNCSGLLCTCSGDVDCNDMFTKESCDISLCPDDGCWCLRLP